MHLLVFDLSQQQLSLNFFREYYSPRTLVNQGLSNCAHSVRQWRSVTGLTRPIFLGNCLRELVAAVQPSHLSEEL